MMTKAEREAQVRSYLGKTVTVEIDRPIGYVHHKGEKTLIYPINYGYIPGVLGGDDEELDVYVLGIDHPLTQPVEVKIVGVVFRRNDVEDKLIAAPHGSKFTAGEMAEAIRFQEKYYDSFVQAIAEE